MIRQLFGDWVERSCQFDPPPHEAFTYLLATQDPFSAPQSSDIFAPAPTHTVSNLLFPPSWRDYFINDVTWIIVFFFYVWDVLS